MDTSQLELVKENVQPLKSGRNIESLRVALDLNQTQKRDETKAEYEGKLASTTDEEKKLEIYFHYINWFEQHYPQGGKEVKALLEKCIQFYYKKEHFNNNERLLSIFLKYTSILDAPLDVFTFFYKSGFGKRLAQFYISWSYAFEAQNNFDKALKVIKAGIHNGAQPIGDMNKALSDLELRTMRHVIANPEDIGEKAGQRKALNSLKAKVDRHGRAEAPVRRTGNAVLSGGSRGLQSSAGDGAATSRGRIVEQLNVLCDENADPVLDPAPAGHHSRLPTAFPGQQQQSLPVINNQENIRDAGKWNENKLQCKGLRKRDPAANFEILEDPDGKSSASADAAPAAAPAVPVESKPEPKVVSTATEKSRNQQESATQDTAVAEFPVAKFEAENYMKKYIWYDQCQLIYKDDTEYSFEELRYQKWTEQQRQRLATIREEESKESSSVIKSIGDLTENDTLMPGTTSIVRGFYNGTLATTTMHSDDNTTVFKTKEITTVVEPVQQFEIYSETTDKFNATAIARELQREQQPQPQPCQVIDEAQYRTQQLEFTVSGLKEEEFNSCSSSTPSANRIFKRPPSLSSRLQKHPNFVTGITAALSPIIETSRDGKSTSSSSGMSSTGSHTTRKDCTTPKDGTTPKDLWYETTEEKTNVQEVVVDLEAQAATEELQRQAQLKQAEIRKSKEMIKSVLALLGDDTAKQIKSGKAEVKSTTASLEQQMHSVQTRSVQSKEVLKQLLAKLQ